MAVENFTTYTEEDPNSRITKTATRVTWADLDRNETAYVCKDKGADYFDADFTHLLTVRMTAFDTDSYLYVWGLANDDNDFWTIKGAYGHFLGIGIVGQRLYLLECDSGEMAHLGDYILSLNTNYYLKIVRDESVGTYGILYCYIYSDSARTTLLDTLTLTLRSQYLLAKKDFRYIYAVSSVNSGHTPYTGSGYSENLVVTGTVAGVAPTVTTQACTDIAPESLTGNGVVTSLGSTTVTQHGICYSTSQNPTIADTITENGIAYQTGHFSSPITSLIPGTTYYFKAYATNSEGTAYGSQVSNTMASSIGRRYWWVEGRDFHWFGEDGIEYHTSGVGVAPGETDMEWWNLR